MEYIFKEHFLPLGNSKLTNIQYYQWTEKRRRDQERTEEEALRKKLAEMDDEDVRDRSKIKGRGHKQQVKDKEVQRQSRPEYIYDKNLLWKNEVNKKVEKMRNQRREEEEKQELQHQQPQLKQKTKKMFRDPTHKGPFKAWGQRFQHYLRAKDGDNQDQSSKLFKPTINQKSKTLTMNMQGRVEDRLIDYGERLKEKRVELQQQLSQQIGGKHKDSQVSIDSNLSDTFFRLYKDGQRFNRKKNEFVSEYSFTPEINRNSAIMAHNNDKRKPLYDSKLTLPNKDRHKEEKSRPKRDKQQNQKSFNDFLMRNQALLTKIGKNKNKKMDYIRDKQNNQDKQCTFIPVLNAHSLKIVANRSEHMGSKAHQFSQNSEFKQITRSHVQPVDHTDLSAFDNKCSLFHPKSGQKQEDGASQKNLICSHLLFNSSDIQSRIHEPSLNQGRRVTEMQSEAILTDRFTEENQTVILEELQDDSIERERNTEWENDLDMMESQIEAMMKRSGV